MKAIRWFGISILSVGLTSLAARAQAPRPPQGTTDEAVTSNTVSPSLPIDLQWTPPALAQLSAQAAAKSEFTLDRTMLAAAASLLPDSDQTTRQAIAKLDGVSIHLLNFGAASPADPDQLAALRDAYRQHGWKHLVSTTASAGPVHNGTTDLWLVLDGVNLRGAVLLVQTPKSLTLATLKGDLSTVDLLHLRGHFGIPRFDGDSFKDDKEK
jgi:hypothetical protein